MARALSTRRRAAVTAAAWLGIMLLAAEASQAGDVAIVVNPANPTAEVSGTELQRMLRLETQHWRRGKRIYLVLLESGTPEKNLLLRRVFRMDDAELRQYWLGKVYRGEIPSYPRVVASAASVKRIVAQASNALGFVDASDVDGSVKVLAIDGRRPGERGYLLAGDGVRAP